MTEQFAALQLGVTLLFVWAFWFYCWKPSAVDKLRQNLFDLRHELFIVAAKHPKSDIAFGTPAYNEFRNTLNGIIRFAHEFDVIRPCLYRVMARAPILGLKIDTTRAAAISKRKILAVTNPKIRHRLEDMLRRFDHVVFWYLAKASPFFWLLMVGVVIRVFADVIIAKVKAVARRQWELLRFPTVKPLKVRTHVQLSDVYQAVWSESQDAETYGGHFEPAHCRDEASRRQLVTSGCDSGAGIFR